MRISDWSSDVCSSDVFARLKVVKIESFTEPADAAGVKVSRVTYDYELKDVEPWATGPDFAGAFPPIAALLAKTGNQAPDVLAPTDNGWKHERELHRQKALQNTRRNHDTQLRADNGQYAE